MHVREEDKLNFFLSLKSYLLQHQYINLIKFLDKTQYTLTSNLAVGLHSLCVTGGRPDWLISAPRLLEYLVWYTFIWGRVGGRRKSFYSNHAGFTKNFFYKQLNVRINAYILRCRLWFSSRLNNKSVQTVHSFYLQDQVNRARAWEPANPCGGRVCRAATLKTLSAAAAARERQACRSGGECQPSPLVLNHAGLPGFEPLKPPADQ